MKLIIRYLYSSLRRIKEIFEVDRLLKRSRISLHNKYNYSLFSSFSLKRNKDVHTQKFNFALKLTKKGDFVVYVYNP